MTPAQTGSPTIDDPSREGEQRDDRPWVALISMGAFLALNALAALAPVLGISDGEMNLRLAVIAGVNGIAFVAVVLLGWKWPDEAKDFRDRAGDLVNGWTAAGAALLLLAAWTGELQHGADIIGESYGELATVGVAIFTLQLVTAWTRLAPWIHAVAFFAVLILGYVVSGL